jgi:hypothetical protein
VGGGERIDGAGSVPAGGQHRFGFAVPGVRRAVWYPQGGVGGALPGIGLGPTLRPAHLGVRKCLVGARHVQPQRGGRGADTLGAGSHRDGTGGLNRALFRGQIASSTAELSPVSPDPQPELGERHGRGHPRFQLAAGLHVESVEGGMVGGVEIAVVQGDLSVRRPEQTLAFRVYDPEGGGVRDGRRRGIVSPTRGVEQRNEPEAEQLRQAAGALIA